MIKSMKTNIEDCLTYNASESSVVRRCGYFDTDNGLFLQSKEGRWRIISRVEGVDCALEELDPPLDPTFPDIPAAQKRLSDWSNYFRLMAMMKKRLGRGQ
jgi:hypothetical protein